MSGNATLARPYAVAALRFAKERDAVASWSDQLAFLATVIADPSIRALIANPKFGREKLETLLLELGQDALDPGGKNFVRVLIANGRIAIAPEIAAAFEALRAQDDARIDVQVASAYDLSADQTAAIVSAMQAKFGREIKLTATADAALIGGVVIRAGDQVIDASLRGRMNQLALDLAQ